MSDQKVSVREIDWQELCPWLILVRALRLALFRGRVLLLAVAGLIATTAGFRLVGDAFFDHSSDKLVQEWIAVDSPWPWSAESNAIAATPSPERFSPRTVSPWLADQGFLGAWQWIARPVQRLFNTQSTWRSMFYSILCGLWAIVVWAIFGGAITRIAALDMTRNESLGMQGAIAQTMGRIGSFIAAPLLPILFVLIATLPLMVVGLLMRASFFAWLAGIGWILILGMGLIMAIVLILFYVGWPLMWATLSVERSDAFDAFGRCYSYVYERPFRLLFSVGVAAILGWIGVAVVQVFATATISLADWSISWGTGNERICALQQIGDEARPASQKEQEQSQKSAADSPSESRRQKASQVSWFDQKSAGAIQFWKNFLKLVVVAFPIGFLWTSSVAIYLLQRRAIDATEMDEVVVEDQAGTYGLPPLREHPSGVPSMEGDGSPREEGKDGEKTTESE